MKLAITHIGDFVHGELHRPPPGGDSLIAEDGVITWFGDSSECESGDADQVLDASGACVVPGFIDSHVHVAFGDYTPRQRTVGFLESYLHGGMTTAISASEIHVPGRPRDPVGVKSLAIAAQRCYADYRPGGVTVYGGSVILVSGLSPGDFADLRENGVRLAKAGFADFADPRAYVELVRNARDAGLVVMFHCGGASIAGSSQVIDADLLLEARPNVLGHVNGGPTALAARDGERLVVDGGDMALQLVEAGNLSSALAIASLAVEHRCMDRLLIASDTPTGSGVIPLAMLRMMAHLVSLGPLSPDVAIAAATGNVARVYGIPGGHLGVGQPADLTVLDAPTGSQAKDWRQALEIGDLPSVAAVVTRGEVRFVGSRNTPPAKRSVRLASGALAA